MAEVDLQYFERGPGPKLRKAREARGLKIKEVAPQLYLTKHRVEEIENNDFSRVPSLLHARGYLRSYAKLLGLAEHEVDYDLSKYGLAVADVVEDIKDIMNPPTTRAIERQQKFVRIMNVTLVIVLGLLLTGWWQNSGAVSSKLHSFWSVAKKVIVPSRIN